MKRKRFISVNEAAEILSVSPRSVRRLIADRTLAAAKCRGSLRIVASSLDEYIKEICAQHQLENGEAIYPGEFSLTEYDTG